MENRKKLNFTYTLLFLAATVIIIGGLFLILAGANERRSKQVVEEYTQETNQYIQKNRNGLEMLFTNVFPDSACTDKDQWNCQIASQDAIMAVISDDLKDFSSTSFIRKNSQGRIIQMHLSGAGENIDISYKPDLNNHLNGLLDGTEDSIPWDTYVNYNNKEVIIPVKDRNGHTMGAIVRVVIE